MKQLDTIRNLILNEELEQACELLINCEETHIDNSDYWSLKGMLFFYIGEYNESISCYIKSLNIKDDNVDSLYNLAHIYNCLEETLLSFVCSGIALRYNQSDEFVNDIYNLYSNYELIDKIKEFINDITENTSLTLNNFSLFRYIAHHFDNIDEQFITTCEYNTVDYNWVLIKDDYCISYEGISKIEDFVINSKTQNLNLVIIFDTNYINTANTLVEKGVTSFDIIVPTHDNQINSVKINNIDIEYFKNKNINNIITLNIYNNSDGNIDNLIKNIPKKIKNKYKLNIIHGEDVNNIETAVRVSLKSKAVISSFNTFKNYPKEVYKFEIHNKGIYFKKPFITEQDFKNEYDNVDKIFLNSQFNKSLLNSIYDIPEEKYCITGTPKTDMIFDSTGVKNIEKLLNINLNNKKVIFNLPTYRIDEKNGRVKGDPITHPIKLKNFDYERFDKFLENNNCILISKSHNLEERIVASKTKNYELKNTFFISDTNLIQHNLNLYELLNGANLFITDYSSIYGDLLFTGKPIILLTSDIDTYRKENDIITETCKFLDKTPIVRTQETLELEINNYLQNPSCNKEQREELKNMIYKHNDNMSTARIWEEIDHILSSM